MPTPKKSSIPTAAAEREAYLAEVRQQIAAGTYETHERLEAAVDALLDELTSEPPRTAPRPK